MPSEPGCPGTFLSRSFLEVDFPSTRVVVIFLARDVCVYSSLPGRPPPDRPSKFTSMLVMCPILLIPGRWSWSSNQTFHIVVGRVKK